MMRKAPPPWSSGMAEYGVFSRRCTGGLVPHGLADELATSEKQLADEVAAELAVLEKQPADNVADKLAALFVKFNKQARACYYISSKQQNI